MNAHELTANFEDCAKMAIMAKKFGTKAQWRAVGGGFLNESTPTKTGTVLRSQQVTQSKNEHQDKELQSSSFHATRTNASRNKAKEECTTTVGDVDVVVPKRGANKIIVNKKRDITAASVCS